MAKKQKIKLGPVRSRNGLSPSWLPAGETLVPAPAEPWPAFCPENHSVRHPLGADMLSEQAWQEIACSLKLSGQELRIVREAFDDCAECVIADNLKVSPHTIHTHFERLYRKLAVTNRVKLILRVIDEYHALTVANGSVLTPLCANRAAGRCPFQRS
jgi:hypothetical protein